MVTLIQVPNYIALLKKYSSKPTVTKWLKADGEFVEKDEVLVTVETSKASLELEAPAAGLVFILKKVGEKVKIGDTLGVIADQKAEVAALKDSLSNYPFV